MHIYIFFNWSIVDLKCCVISWRRKWQPTPVLLPGESRGRRSLHGVAKSRTWLLLFLSSVQSISRVRLFVTPWITACQVSLCITNSQSSLKFMSIELVMLSSHLILCWTFFLLSPIPPNIRVFSNESALSIKWPKYCSFSFSISHTNETQDWSPLGWTGWISLQSKGLSRVFSNTTVQKYQFFGAQLS